MNVLITSVLNISKGHYEIEKKDELYIFFGYSNNNTRPTNLYYFLNIRSWKYVKYNLYSVHL